MLVFDVPVLRPQSILECFELKVFALRTVFEARHRHTTVVTWQWTKMLQARERVVRVEKKHPSMKVPL